MGLELSHNIDAEQAVLGCVLITRGGEAMAQIDHLLDDGDFYTKQHQYIFAAMKDMWRNRDSIDLITLSELLQVSGELENVGGSSYLAELTSAISTAHNVTRYAKIVAHHSRLRQLLTTARRIAEYSQDTQAPLDEVLAKAEKELHSITRGAIEQDAKLELADLNDYMILARKEKAAPGMVQGLSTGLFKIDKMTEGFVPGELMIISGQTSHGKTQLANNIILKTVQAGKKAMFVTMEMTKKEVGDRFNYLNDDKDIGEGKVLLNMSAELKYTDVTKLVERAKEKGCDLVVIDHLHYFSRSVENATQEISKIVKEFKGAAVTYELPIILICHVRKMAPKKHPTLEDLRDSSLIAQDADMVLIVWRDESPSAQDPFKVEVVLWKNRNRQKRNRREYLYADGLKLVETEPSGPVADARKMEYAENNARILGERDSDDEDDLSIESEDGQALELKSF